MVQGQAAVLEEPGEDAVHDGGADLALDVVTDDGDARVAELAGPFGVRGDEDRNGVDEGDAGLQAGLGIVALGLLGADREVGDQHVGPGVAQGLAHVDGRGRGLLDHLAVVLAQAVEGGPALDGDPHLADVGEADGVVQPGVDGLAEVGADLGLVHVERGDGDDVADVVPTEIDVHQTGDGLLGLGVAVVRDALDQRAGAVADAGDRETDWAGHRMSPSYVRSAGAGWKAARSLAISRSSQLMSWATLSAVCCTTERA